MAIRKRRLFLALTFIPIFIVGYAVLAIQMNWEVSFLNINPPPSLTVVPVPISGSDSNGPIFLGTMFLRFNGTLAAGNPVMVTAIGQLFTPQLATQVAAVGVGISGSLPYPPANATGASFPVTQMLNLNPNSNGSLIENETLMVYFPIAGSYLPQSFVLFNNAAPSYSTPTEGVVTVGSASELEAAKTNRITVALTWALLYFSAQTAFFEVVDHVFGKETATVVQSEATNAIPDAKQTNPNVKKKPHAR